MGLDALLDLLFPPKCPFCEKITDKLCVCPSCRRTLPVVSVQQALREGAGYGRCVFPLYYEGAVRQSLLQFKFGGRASWAGIYADFLAECVAEQLAGEFDCVTWVPVSGKRLRKRGYDQARLLAEAVGRLWSTPPIALLKKVRDTPAQSLQQDAAARRGNVLGVYEALPAAASRRVLLIDDILTTGSTLAECARVLREAGAVTVVCATLAGSRSGDKSTTASAKDKRALADS